MKKPKNANILITKASGESEPFSEKKLRNSLERVHLEPNIIDQITKKVARFLEPGMTTSQIYGYAFSLLKKHKHPAAARFSLKKALMALGPTGHPFEKLVGELLFFEGFKVKTNVIAKGFCVSHELDVEAQKKDLHIMVECKFHHQIGIKSDVKIPLYIQARFLDIERQAKKTNRFHEAWIITNTKFTSDAIQYALCVGMKLIGWNFPENAGLEEKIERYKLYPITCLTTLSNAHKRLFFENGITLCKEIRENMLRPLGISQKTIDKIMNEINYLSR